MANLQLTLGTTIQDNAATITTTAVCWFLARHPDRPFTRMQLLEGIWDIQYEGYDRTIDSHVQRLRAKIEPDPERPEVILTVRGVGYKAGTG